MSAPTETPADKLARAVREAVLAAPPLTEAQRNQIARLLPATGSDAA